MLKFNRVSEHREPCLIACKDGVSASGLFVVLSYIFRKYEKELDIDVCNAIRTARRNGTEFIDSAVREFPMLSILRSDRLTFALQNRALSYLR
jgi:hypothetical protein